MRHTVSAALVLALTTAAGCGGGGDGPMDNDGGGNNTPANIALVSGGGQRVAVGERFLAALVVKVTDAGGRSVSGVSVAWAVTAGGGSLSATSVTTGATGEAAVFLTSGSAEGQNTVTATAAGLTGSSVTFTATGAVPSAMTLAAGDGQSARISQPLAQSLAVRVTAADGGVVPAATVNWEVTAGGGTLSPAMSTIANASGRASVDLKLGSGVGMNSVTATLDGAPGPPPSVTFDATGTTPVSVTVSLMNIAFNAPGGGDDVAIMLGDTVRWVNDESISHTATSNSVPAGGSAFDSGTLNLNDTFFFVPDVRGTWVYNCQFHPTVMVDARITVG